MLLLLLLPKRAMLQLRSHALLLYTRLCRVKETHCVHNSISKLKFCSALSYLHKAPREFLNRRIIQGRVEHALNL